jgi:hypothetical protein
MKIFVGGLSRDATEEDVQSAFAAYGKVTSVAVLKDKFTGEPRGFGFVEMESKAEAEAAINALNGTQLKGRSLTVNEARPRTDRPRGGGGGGGGGYGGGGGGGGGRGGGGYGGERRGGGGGRGGRGGGGGGGGWGNR